MRVSLYMACSVDGFVATPDGDVSFLDVAEGDDYGMAEYLGSVDALILGRATLETVLGFDVPWPYDDLRVFVASSSLEVSPHPKATLVCGEPAEVLAAVGDAAHVWIDGPETGRRFLAAGLVDDITLTVIPVVLGDGIPYFGRQERPLPLELVSSRSWDNGVVQTTYRPKAND